MLELAIAEVILYNIFTRTRPIEFWLGNILECSHAELETEIDRKTCHIACYGNKREEIDRKTVSICVLWKQGV